ncbi:hypothetical protein SAMN04488544_0004 [Microlunatus sagamiharensis]|uniref:Uncharacterized protein n=1 Tax=Microlunatus sagamiharensis TaxID=546874 RepID=A0A1H2LFT8_9ACTN|nr:hypothetical protein SAMN04488544_0004 [Microlunatus sagamiharensis]
MARRYLRPFGASSFRPNFRKFLSRAGRAVLSRRTSVVAMSIRVVSRPPPRTRARARPPGRPSPRSGRAPWSARGPPLGDPDVVEADDGQLARDGDPHRPRRLVDPSARTSDAAKTAVGRCSSVSSRRPCSMPSTWWNSAGAGAPCAARARRRRAPPEAESRRGGHHVPGPVTMAISRWPSSMRWRAAAYAPLQSAEPIVGTSAGRPRWAEHHEGDVARAELLQLRRLEVGGDEHRADGRRLRTPSIHRRRAAGGRWCPRRRPDPRRRATRSIEASASLDHQLSIS